MKFAYALTILALICFNGYGQTLDAARLEFEVASIKAAPPVEFFHSADSGTGGPGSADPSTFRCVNCTLSSLILKAFSLQAYQFPGRQSLPGDAFVITAKIPEGATQAQFPVMLQNFLKNRFGLAYHFDQKEMQGYLLSLARNGPKLDPAKQATPAVESGARAAQGAADSQHAGGTHGAGGWAGSADRPGLTFFNGGARYRGDGQTVAAFAQLLANQLGKPVDDQTGLTGRYDIRLNWTGDTAHSGNHPDGAAGINGFAGHDHGGQNRGTGNNSAATSDDAMGPTLFDALQSQLGLKLVAAPKSAARIFVVDHVEKTPTEN